MTLEQEILKITYQLRSQALESDCDDYRMETLVTCEIIIKELVGLLRAKTAPHASTTTVY